MDFLVSGLFVGFALIGVIIGIIGVTKGRHFLSGQIMPLQQIHEIYDPGLTNTIEIEDNEQSEQDQSGDNNI